MNKLKVAARWVKMARTVSDEVAEDMFCNFCDAFNLNDDEQSGFGSMCW